MKKRFLVLTILFGLARAFTAQASPFIIEYSNHNLSKKGKSNTWLEEHFDKIYRFVSHKVTDKVDRTKCPIKIKFRNLEGKHFASINRYNKDCEDIIYLEEKLPLEETPLYLIHELTHLFRHQYNRYEERWLDEGLANLVKYLYLKKWPQEIQERIKKQNDFTLSNDENNYTITDKSGYDSSSLLLLYLYHRLGNESFLTELLKSEKTGWDSVENAAKKVSSNDRIKVYLNRQSLLACFAIALLLNTNDLDSNSMYHFDFDYQPLIKFTDFSFTNVPLLRGNQFSSDVIPFYGRVQFITNKSVLKQLTNDDPRTRYYYIGYISLSEEIFLKSISLKEHDELSKQHERWVLIQVSF